jgi:hypothetical protein
MERNYSAPIWMTYSGGQVSQEGRDEDTRRLRPIGSSRTRSRGRAMRSSDRSRFSRGWDRIETSNSSDVAVKREKRRIGLGRRVTNHDASLWIRARRIPDIAYGLTPPHCFTKDVTGLSRCLVSLCCLHPLRGTMVKITHQSRAELANAIRARYGLPIVCRRLEEFPNITSTQLFEELCIQFPGRFHAWQLRR